MHKCAQFRGGTAKCPLDVVGLCTVSPLESRLEEGKEESTTDSSTTSVSNCVKVTPVAVAPDRPLGPDSSRKTIERFAFFRRDRVIRDIMVIAILMSVLTGTCHYCAIKPGRTVQ